MTRRGEPVGELRPLRRHRFADSRAVVEVFRGAPPVDWQRLREDVDATVEQDIESRA